MYYYKDYIADLKKLLKLGRGIIQVVDNIKSYDGREIVALQIGTGKVRGIVSGGIHGREYINTPVLLRLMYKMIKDIKKGNINLIKDNSLIIVPLVNPDGFEIATRGYGSIKNRNLRKLCLGKGIEWRMWKYNARGVDINRNFDSVLWKSKYDNDMVFSEIESQFLKGVMDKYMGEIYIDIHSRGENIYYYRNVMNEEYNSKQFFIANRIADLTGYRISVPSEEIDEGDSGGNTVHYYSEKYGLSAITIETVKEEANFPLEAVYIDKVYDDLEKLLALLITGIGCF